MNITKTQLKQITYDSMVTEQTQSGESEFTLIEISKMVYHSLTELGITPEDDVFYTYQYDLRWCLQQLREEGVTNFKKVGKINLHFLTASN
tara:strand:+ start:884 stop:1156 length:273 start_codon:yes stop_codon:yes gene_type:complete